MNPNNKNTISVALTCPAQRQQLLAVAKKNHTTISEIVQKALEAYLKPEPWNAK